MLRREVDEATQQVRNASYRSAKDRMYRTLAREEWLLPDRVHDTFNNLRRVLEAHYDSWFEDLDAGSFGVATAKKELIHEAKRDLTTLGGTGRQFW
jgi:hypothetical protein